MVSSSAIANPAPTIRSQLSQHGSGLSIVLSVLLIACGFLAILLPIEMSFGVALGVAWLLMISGVVQFTHARLQRCWVLWKILVAIVFFGTGLYLRLNLGREIAALTLVLIAFFVAPGIA